jgi:hypothetical protein
MSQTPDRVEQFNQTSPLEVANETSKKAYHAPHLRDYGHVRELTQTNATFNVTPDGGTIPNFYAS